MPEITITTTATFDPERWAEDAMYIPGMWLTSAAIEDDGVTYTWYHDGGDGEPEGERTERVLWSRIGWAMAHLAGGTYTDYSGAERKLNDYQARAAYELVHDFDNADWDAETDDLIAQMAVFGKVIYG